MLPEYLLTGHSMQDISRDDFSILNGIEANNGLSTEKTMCPTLVCKIQNISPINACDPIGKQQINIENNEITANVPIKLEDINTIDLYSTNPSSWQQYSSLDAVDQRTFLNSSNTYDGNSTKLLLQGSDDPLISHGANSVLSNDDEHLADFVKNLNPQANDYFQNAVNAKNKQEVVPKLTKQQKIPPRFVKSGCSNLTKQQLKAKANLMSARNQQQQQQQNTTTKTTTASQANQNNQHTQRNSKHKKATTLKLRFHHQALPAEYLSHYEATQGQLGNCKNQQTLLKPANSAQKQTYGRNSNENVRSWLQKIAELQRSANAAKESNTTQTHKTLENSLYQTATEKLNEAPNASTDNNNNYKLEKALQEFPNTHANKEKGNYLATSIYNNNTSNSKRTQSYTDLPYMGEITLDHCKPRRGRKPKKADICHLIYKNYGTIMPHRYISEVNANYISESLSLDSDGLTRESSEQPLNLCLRDQINDSYSISSGDELSETNSNSALAFNSSLLSNKQDIKRSSKNINEHHGAEHKTLSTTNHIPPTLTEENVANPLTLCYKKLMENGCYKTIKKDNQLALKIPIPNGFMLTHKLEKSSSKPIQFSPDSFEALALTETAVSESQNQQLKVVPQKRKRSAIFIPPMNVENSNNPATEVSICKFKFTGGSKPTLQEKKMISVDAGGNYRYFSGTGDKSSRGYEYFPRESLQQTAGLLPGVNCIGQKLSADVTSRLHDFNAHESLQSTRSSLLPAPRTANINTEVGLLKPTNTSFEGSKNNECLLGIKENLSYSSSSPNLRTNHSVA